MRGGTTAPSAVGPPGLNGDTPIDHRSSRDGVQRRAGPVDSSAGDRGSVIILEPWQRPGGFGAAYDLLQAKKLLAQV